MFITNNFYKYSLPTKNYCASTSPNFGNRSLATIAHTNLGVSGNGIIGRVQVRRANGSEAYLNVMRNATIANEETYQLQEQFGKVIGEISFKINNQGGFEYDFDNRNFRHVFVDFLRNYSNPNTKYYRAGLQEYKDVGLRLMQIAQRRSDESNCYGNIVLCSKEDSMPFYEKLGLKVVSKDTESNVNREMFLPAESKEAMSKMQGGL